MALSLGFTATLSATCSHPQPLSSASLSFFPSRSLCFLSSLSRPSPPLTVSPSTLNRRFPCLSPPLSSASSSSPPSPSPSSSLPSLLTTEAIPVRAPDGSLTELPASPGVYGVYDSSGKLQYMGLTRRLVTSVHGHVADLPELCDSVKILAVDAQNRDALAAAWKAWMEEHMSTGEGLPPGNAQGDTTWTAKRAKPAKADQKLTPGPHVTLTIPMTELIGKIVKEHKVVAFIKGSRTAPQCGFSHRVLTILNEARVDYETFNVLDEHHNAGLRDGVKEYSQWPTIPQLYVKGEFIGGADILDEMTASGEIKTLFS